MNPRNFFAELKRRNVYKVAVAYAIVGWLLIQIATQTFPFFEIPSWSVRLVVLLVALGFPAAVVLAWAYELTPEGIKRTDEVRPGESITRGTGRKLDFLIIGVLVTAYVQHDRFAAAGLDQLDRAGNAVGEGGSSRGQPGRLPERDRAGTAQLGHGCRTEFLEPPGVLGLLGQVGQLLGVGLQVIQLLHLAFLQCADVLEAPLSQRHPPGDAVVALAALRRLVMT